MTNRTRMAPAAAAAFSVYVPLRAAAETDFTFYGRLNLSVDVGSQGLAGLVCNNPNLCTPGAGPQGNLRWIPDVSSNLSRFGIRGHHDLLEGVQAVFQLEAEVAVAATPGVKGNGNNDTINPGNNAINGAIASRNSFVGIATPLARGRSARATRRTSSRPPISISSPIRPATTTASSGTRAATTGPSSTRASPTPSGTSRPTCTAFGSARCGRPGRTTSKTTKASPSASLSATAATPALARMVPGGPPTFAATWEKFGFKAVAAYELHKRVNRSGDAGATTPAGVSTVGVADEQAWKFGAKYTLALTGTTVAGLYEDLRRDDVGTFNERQRSGFYFSALQKVTPTMT